MIGGRRGELFKQVNQQDQAVNRTSVLTQHILLPELRGSLDTKLFPIWRGKRPENTKLMSGPMLQRHSTFRPHLVSPDALVCFLVAYLSVDLAVLELPL